jgi:hypothetical protein
MGDNKGGVGKKSLTLHYDGPPIPGGWPIVLFEIGDRPKSPYVLEICVVEVNEVQNPQTVTHDY